MSAGNTSPTRYFRHSGRRFDVVEMFEPGTKIMSSTKNTKTEASHKGGSTQAGGGQGGTNQGGGKCNVRRGKPMKTLEPTPQMASEPYPPFPVVGP